MSDIPADIMAVAQQVASDVGAGLAIGSAETIACAILAERERILAFEGGYPRPLGKSFRSDGVASKNDKCVHGNWMYEDCEACLFDAIRGST